MNNVSHILSAIDQGDPTAADKLLPLVYQELRKLANEKLANEQPGQTIQPTVLVHEAYLRLVNGDKSLNWNGRGHFFGAAAEAMRRILIENARRKQRQRHGGGRQRLDVGGLQLETMDRDEELLTLDDALCQFEQHWPDKAMLVKLRFFSGMTIPEAAQVIGVSPATAERYWTFARAWLHDRLSRNE